MSQHTTAYRVETERMILRCWTPEDAPLFRAMLDESDAYFRPFIPWMRDEPMTLQQTAARLAKHRLDLETDVNYRYAMFDRSDESLIGETGLYTRVGPNATEIGYMVAKARDGRGLATEATMAMVKVAFENDRVERVEIHCSPDNHASARIPLKFGFKLAVTHKDHAEDSEGTLRDSMIWILAADDYAGSLAQATAIKAYDRDGNPIPHE